MARHQYPPSWPLDLPLPQQAGSSHGTEKTCPICKLNSLEHPIHCIKNTSSTSSSYQHSSPSAHSSEDMRALETMDLPSSPTSSSRPRMVPVLRLETPSRWYYRPQPPGPALRFDVSSVANARARTRSRHISFSPLSPALSPYGNNHGRRGYTSGSSVSNTPVDDNLHNTKISRGLEIPDPRVGSGPSLIQSPGAEQMVKAEKGEFTSTTSAVEASGSNVGLFKMLRIALQPWTLELMSWLLSMICMSAIVVLLLSLENKPFPKHWPMNITLNAYIAILSRITTGALLFPVSEALGQLKWIWFQGRSKKMRDFELFDNASRGPWGSAILLIRTKGRKLAALGAVITIFLLAMDPIFQQAVRYPQRVALHTLNSSIATAIRYEPLFGPKFQARAKQIDYDLEMVAVIEKAFFDYETPDIVVGNATQVEIPLSCPTSNCTWEPYQTLGVCSECLDAIDMLGFDCLPGRLDWIRNSTAYIKPSYGYMCGWFLNATHSTIDNEDLSADVPILMLGYQADLSTNQSSGEILTTRTMPLITSINRIPKYDGSVNFKHVRNPLTNFVVVSTEAGPDKDSILESILQHKKPRALECVMSWCVKTISSSFHDGTYTEEVTERFINTTSEFNNPWSWLAPFDDGKPKKEFEKMLQYTHDVIITPPIPDKHHNMSTFGMNNQTAFNIITILDDYLPAFATLANNASRQELRFTAWEESPYHRDFPKNPWAGPNNITRHMDRLATVMTNIMRRMTNDTVYGQSFIDETYISVRWGWLSLPLSLLGLTLIFTVGTALRTSQERHRVGVWKTSAIATLLYGLPDEMQKKITDTHGHGMPQSKAKKLNVRMLPTKDWRISGHVVSPTSQAKGSVRK